MHLETDLRKEVIELLCRCPELTTRDGRDAWLLRNLPKDGGHNWIVKRSDHTRTDLTFIIDVVQGLQFEEGRWVILDLINDQASSLDTLTLGQILQTLGQRVEAHLNGGTEQPSGREAQVTILVDGSFEKLGNDFGTRVATALARDLGIKTGQIHILRVQSGSTKITLAMPEEAAQRLVSKYLSVTGQRAPLELHFEQGRSLRLRIQVVAFETADITTQPTTFIQPAPPPSSPTSPSSTTPKAQPDNILIVTVTKTEAQMVLEVFSRTAGKGWTRQAIGSKTYYSLGVHGGAPVYMVQSEMGIATPSGALLTVRQAIQDLRPQAIIMCGIAFGLRPDKQQLGDILVAKQLQYYEPQKVDLQQGQIPRGDRTTSAERLLDRFRSGDNDWQGAQTHFGLVLSGEKLVNDPAFRHWLLEIEPEAIGGEMEGAGLYAAARDGKVDWILVKAICDRGDGKKDDAAQSLAARNAAQFVLHVLQLGGWDRPEQLPADNIVADDARFQVVAFENADDIAPAYDSRLFVDREREIQWVCDKVRMWANSRGREAKGFRGEIVGLEGERAIGKTWLLSHLADTEPLTRFRSVYFDLDARAFSPDPKAYVGDAFEKLETKKSDDVSGAEGIIILLDNVPEELDDYLREFENKILAPGLEIHGSLIVMALAVSDRVCWTRAALRAFDSERLMYFEEEDSSRQFMRLWETGKTKSNPDARRIIGQSTGSPLLNYLLAVVGEPRAFDDFLTHCLVRAGTERQAVIDALEAVCALDALEFPIVQRACNVYRQNQPKAVDLPDAWFLVHLLRRYQLAQRQPKRDALFLAPAIKSAAQGRLKYRNPGLYEKLLK